MVRALGTVGTLRSKMKLSIEKRRKTPLLNHEEEEKLIDNYNYMETVGANKRVEDAEPAIMQE